MGRLWREVYVALIVTRQAERRQGRGYLPSGFSRPQESVVRAGLPVEYLELRPGGVPIQDQYLLGTQGAVEETALVRVLQCLGQLAQEVEPGLEVQPVTALAREKVIQAFGVGVVLEDEGRPLLGGREQLYAQDAVVGDSVEQFVLALRHAPPFRAHGLRRSVLERVDAYPSLRRRH